MKHMFSPINNLMTLGLSCTLLRFSFLLCERGFMWMIPRWPLVLTSSETLALFWFSGFS